MQRVDLGRHEMGELRLLRQQPAGDPAFGPSAALAAADGERARRLRQRRRGAGGKGGAGQTQRSCKGLRHGHATIAVPAILKPKFVPGERLVKNDSLSFVLSPWSSGFGLVTEAEQPGGGETSVIGSLSSNSKSMKYSGSATRKRHELGRRRRVLERDRHMELDQMVGPLLHPVVRHRAEVDRLASDLQRREIADLREAARILPGERRELLALDEFARLGQPLGRKGGIHLVEHPVVHDPRDLSVRRESQLAFHRHPNVWMRKRRSRRREANAQPCRHRAIARPKTQRTDSPSASRSCRRGLLGAKCGGSMAGRSRRLPGRWFSDS